VGIGLADMLVRGAQINAGGFEAFVADLLLNNGQGQLVNVDVMHDMAVAQGMDGQFMQGPALAVLAVFAFQADHPEKNRYSLGR